METEPLREIPLLGGQLTPGIVRVGNTVRRAPKGNAEFAHNLVKLYNYDRGLQERTTRKFRN